MDGPITGTATDATSGISGASSISLTITQSSSGKTWNGTSFASGSNTVTPTTYNSGTGAFTYIFPNTDFAGDGIYTVSALATDAAGNTGASSTNTFKYDTTPPAVSVTYPANNTTYGANWNGTIGGTSSDATSGVASTAVEIKDTTASLYWNGSNSIWQSGAFFNTASNPTNWTYGFAAANLTNGHSYSVTGQATDNAGNVGASTTTTFTYDTTAPSVAITYPANNTTYGANWTGAMTGTSTANASGSTVSTVKVSIQQGSGSCWTGSGNTYTATCPNYVAVTTGTTNWSLTIPTSDFTSGTTYHVTAQATDSYGNVGASTTTTFTYNSTAPSVAITYPANNTTYGANWTGAMTGTSTANASGSTVSTVKVSIQQGSGSCWTGSGNTYTATCPNYVAVTTGTTNWSLTIPTSDFTSGTTYHVTAQATDSAGNVGASTTTTFTYDTTAPSVAITYPANNTTYGANWTGAMTGTSTANASGSTVSTVKVSIQQGSGSCWTGSGNTYTATCPNYVAVTTGTTNWSLTIPTSDFTSGTTYHVTAQATDSYGNVGASTTTTFTYNSTAPSVAITYPANNTTYGANWTGAMTGTSTANASGSTVSTVKVSIQQGSGSCWTGSGNTYTATCPNYVAVTTGTTNWSLTIPTSDFTSGTTYHVTAQATDSYGNNGTSAAVAFTYQAIAHVQDAVAGSGGATSETPTLGSPPTNGNTLILTVGDDGSGSATVSGVSGGGVTTWSKVTSVLGSGSPNLGATEIWYGLVTCSPCTSSNEGVTVTMSHSTNVQLANVSEWSGIATSSPIDSSTSAAATASGTTFTSGPISLTQTGDLIISDAWLASGFGFSSQPAPPRATRDSPKRWLVVRSTEA